MADNHDKAQYATIGHPSIEAIVETRYRFASKKQAQEQLSSILKFFIVSKKSKKLSPLLWIKGFAIRPEENKAGGLGNFARLSIIARDDHYTISAKKITRPLAQHPERKRPKRKHPDWGHPILRSVKKKKRYDSADEAQEELMQLHQEYPEISIPGEGKLHIIIYQPPKAGGKPVQKYTLKVKPADDKFVIQYRKNTYQKKKSPRLAKEKPVGFFTSLVQKKRKK